MCPHHIRISLPAVQHLPCLPSEVESCFLFRPQFMFLIVSLSAVSVLQLSAVPVRAGGLPSLSRDPVWHRCLFGGDFHLAVSAQEREGEAPAAPLPAVSLGALLPQLGLPSAVELRTDLQKLLCLQHFLVNVALPCPRCEPKAYSACVML